jgi:hypothetical protein
MRLLFPDPGTKLHGRRHSTGVINPVIDQRAALFVIFAISFGLLVEQIMLGGLARSESEIDATERQWIIDLYDARMRAHRCRHRGNHRRRYLVIEWLTSVSEQQS